MKTISIGIDTSCYTTSLVAMDQNNNIIYEGRQMLQVKEGTVGLRQSDAFFQHVQYLPKLYKEMIQTIDVNNISCITVSDKPRNVMGSYMPVFTAGERFAEVISTTLSVPLYKISHQENHLYAVICELAYDKAFIGIHISGGTSEILDVNNTLPLEIKILSHTLDISFGKLIDRLGVYMGLGFPCGKTLDDYAQSTTDKYKMKLSIKDKNFNISGIENQLKKLYDRDKDISKISRSLFEYISDVLIEVLNNFQEKEILVSGGVAANTILRQRLLNHYGDRVKFSNIRYATDHSIGNAYYGNVVSLSN